MNNLTGDGGTATSPDGIIWTQGGDFGTFNQSVAWSPSLGLFVVVGDAGAIGTSPDGATWTNHTPGGGSWKAVAWGGGRFLAVGPGGTIRYSTNGSSWSDDIGPSWPDPLDTVIFNDLAWGQSQFVIALSPFTGVLDEIVATPDGVMLATYSDGFGSDNPYAVAWSSALGLWVIGGTGGKLATSPDGVTWATRTSGFGSTMIWTAISSTAASSIAGAPLSGPYCETITSTGDTLTTSAPYLPGSTSVKVDGIFMRPGTYAQVIAGDRDYNEQDPASGAILFGTSRARTVFVCYNVG